MRNLFYSILLHIHFYALPVTTEKKQTGGNMPVSDYFNYGDQGCNQPV